MRCFEAAAGQQPLDRLQVAVLPQPTLRLRVEEMSFDNDAPQLRSSRKHGLQHLQLVAFDINAQQIDFRRQGGSGDGVCERSNRDNGRRSRDCSPLPTRA